MRPFRFLKEGRAALSYCGNVIITRVVLADSGDGHVHEVRVIVFRTVRIVLKALQELQKNLLGDLTPSSL